MDYDSLISSVVTAVHTNGLEEKIRSQVFTRRRFELLQRICWLFFIIGPFCFWIAARYRLAITGFVKFVVMSVLQSIKSITEIFKKNTRLQNKTVVALLIVIILFSIYHMIISFLTYDEMWSYNYYTAQPFYYSFFNYSSYPLFEMTTHFFKGLPFPMKINLRLSSFIFGLASCLLLYACLKKYFNNHFIAIAGLAAFAFMPLTVIFMVNGRGIIHELLFAIAGIFSFLFWLDNPAKKEYMVIYFFAGVAGLYSLSTHFIFLSFLLTAGLLRLVKKDGQSAILFFKTNLLILIVFLILYTPILVTTGFSVFTDVAKSSLSYSNTIKVLPHFSKNILMGYVGYSYLAIVVFFLVSAIVFAFKNKIHGNRKFLFAIIAGLPISGIIFCLLTRVLYPVRVIAFGALYIPLLTCLFLQLTEPWFKSNSVKIIAGVSAIIVVIVLNWYIYLPIIPFDRDVAVVSRFFLDKKINSCYDNLLPGNKFYYYYPGIEYYYSIEHRTIEFTLSAKNSMRYKPFLPGDKYDCIVYSSNVPDSIVTPAYHVAYCDSIGKFKVWLRNDLK